MFVTNWVTVIISRTRLPHAVSCLYYYYYYYYYYYAHYSYY